MESTDSGGMERYASTAEAVKRKDELDFSPFPAEAVTHSERWICLACVLDIFIRHMGVAARTAHSEVARYVPTLAELNAEPLSRPFFKPDEKKALCPYCQSPGKWHARLSVHRIEGGKATDAARRTLIKELPTKGEPLAMIEEKATRQHAFFEWLENLSDSVNLDDPRWLRDISFHWLSRKEPKTDWKALFEGNHGIKRSRRLEEGSESERGLLFLAPMIFDELLLVQYLVSRSHKSGGLTLEGRYTLAELIPRLRRSGYLRSVEIGTGNPDDALEQLVAHLGGGEASVKFYTIVDRREYLERAKAVKILPLRRPVKKK